MSDKPRRHVWTKRSWNGKGTPVQCCVNCGFMKMTERFSSGTGRTRYLEARYDLPPRFGGPYRPCDGHGPPEGLAIKQILARHGIDLRVQYYVDNGMGDLHVRFDIPEDQVARLHDLIAGRLERRQTGLSFR